MKKIININLGGVVIPIEDTAYEKLQAYIESLRRYFSAEEGRDEIINDIENRIAELMNDKVRKGATNITEDDINEIIKGMGSPEALEAEEEEHQKHNGNNGNTSYASAPKTKRRLYRDNTDKIIGGVCAGLADYLNVDPTIVRLLFAIVAFGGWGFGFLLYIVLWIILPEKNLDGYHGKRLFRNPDEKVLGGVASGLAAYFNKETWVIRLIFAGPLILNIFFGSFNWWAFSSGSFIPGVVFGSLSGTFFLAYLVMWIVLPLAKTPYDKMEMRGETVDVNKIRENVKSEMSQFKEKMGDMGQELKESAANFGEKAKEFSNTRGKEFANEVRQAAKPVAGRLGHAIGVLFKAFFIFVGGSIALGLFVAFMVVVFGGIGMWPLKKAALDFLLDGFWQQTTAWVTVILLLVVPIVAFFTWLIRRLMNVKSQNRYLGWIFGGLWALGFVALPFFVSSVVHEFNRYEKVGSDIEITQPANDLMTIMVTEPEIEFGSAMWWLDTEGGWDITEDSLKYANVNIDFNLSMDTGYHVKVWKYSAGKTRKLALEKAEKVQFNAQYFDGVLGLGSGLAIDRESKFRGQRVLVEVQVPRGKKIIVDESVTNIYHPVNFRVKRNNRWKRGDFDIDIDLEEDFEWTPNVEYIMAANGQLERVDGSFDFKRNNNGTEYRYKKNQDDIRKEIEAQKRKIEEEKRKLEKVERKLEESDESTTRNKETVDEIKSGLKGEVITPLVSMVNFFTQ
jgi:phage shock protein PspC (stress-responsive transcriptional regulator)